MSDSLLDSDQIAMLRELPGSGGLTLFDELLDVFYENTAGLLHQIQTSASQSDWTTLIRVAHTLKGSSGALGACHLYELAAELEAAAKENQTLEPAFFKKLNETFEQTRFVLEKERTLKV
jgi:HPt (histidine-containing phosphotransfer) domain-containing protein